MHDGKETLFIIISSSMPEADIREYFKRLEGKGGVIFILRGLVGSEKRFGPTKEYLEKIVKKHPTDPNNQEVFNVAVKLIQRSLANIASKKCLPFLLPPQPAANTIASNAIATINHAFHFIHFPPHFI